MIISPSTSGAISELLVCSDLLQKGYQVFRSVSPAADFDLITYKDGETKRIEVRTSYASYGKPNYPLKESDSGKFDTLALVVRNNANRIIYIDHDDAFAVWKTILRKSRNSVAI